MNPRVFAILMAPVAATIMGLVVSEYWRWFIVPFGVAPVGIAHATALVMLVRIVAARRPRSALREETISDAARDFAFNCFTAGVLLAFGWVLTWWMP